MITPPARTVAMIDDDRRVLSVSANPLASGGYETRAYESPLDFFADGYAGLVCVITDLGMRPVDGIQVLERTFFRPDYDTRHHHHGQAERAYGSLVSPKRRVGFL